MTTIPTVPEQLFISDLHLTPNRPALTTLFANFMSQKAQQAEAIYILGDFFKLWIGDDNRTEFNDQIIAILQKASKLTKIYLMPGNRDVALGQDFARASNCTLIPDPYKIDLYGTPTLLSHGDMFCTKDTKHMIFRKLMYTNKISMRLFMALPLNFRKAIAETIHKHSYRHNQRRKHLIPYLSQQKIIDLMQKYQTTQIIHGHIHQTAIKQLTDQNQNYKHFILGEWNETTGNYLIYREDGTYGIRQFEVNGN